MNTREQHLVELVGTDGSAIGETTVDLAHRAPGRLHRAFSVLLVSPEGKVLVQRRAAVKTRFPLRWANACCGHPGPGEALVEAADRRLMEELGVTAVPLREVGVYVYQAADPDSGRVEFEYDHVLVGPYSGDPTDVDPDEVAAVDWVTPAELAQRITRSPESYAPWLAGVLDTWQASANG
ncbi:isopentenyl-diphosphate Delta-isomerase [Dactylosporangium sp. NPDC000555]|uniref:isopentenyl-diphosphate Delta-isomerase n=1 Tax=Dactylosporangium sp. NPDC000555 TaxID=3154260 RepID=UPI0033230B38